MINYNDPELVFIKSFRGNKNSFFQISSYTNISVILKDVEHGGFFDFKRKQFEQYLKNGLLKVKNIKEIPDSLILKPVSGANSITKKKKVTKKFNEELERKFKYVQAAVQSREVRAYTAKWLEPWIAKMAVELNDSKPPNWRTLTNWISDYIKSGWKKESLMPRHNDKGRRCKNSEAEKIMVKVIREFSVNKVRVNYTAAHKEYVSRIEAINIKKASQNLPLLKPISSRTMTRRFKGYK